MTLTTELYIQIILMFLIGQAITFFAIDLPNVRELYKKSNEKFSLSRWMSHDYNIYVTAQLIGIAILIGLPEILHWKPSWIEKIRWGACGIGFIASALPTRLGRYRKRIVNIIDRKTNIADGIDPQKPTE